jgi:hypothetical protein
MTIAVIDRIKKVKGQQKVRFDGKHRKPMVNQENDLVLLQRMNRESWSEDNVEHI